MPETARIHRDVVCPFCSLLCDDLVVSNDAEQLQVTANGCKRAARGFEMRITTLGPHVDGREVSLKQAVAEAARLLRDAQLPVIGGLDADVAGIREAVHLAESCGGVIDHMYSSAACHNMQVLQSEGWMMTTFAELRNRADCVVLVGTDAHRHFPRFFERFVWPANGGAEMRRRRRVAYLGNVAERRPGRSPDGRRALHVRCEDRELLDLLLRLRVMLDPAKRQAGDSPSRELRQLAEWIAASRYCVFVWAPAELRQDHADLVVRAICHIVRDRNRGARAAGLSLGGGSGGASAQSVCAWQTGYPFRVSFADGAPRYDLNSLAAESLFENGQADALLWLNTTEPERPPNRRRVPTIMIARSTRRVPPPVNVFVPVGIPGVDHAGNLFRSDTTVAMRLRQVRHAGLPCSAAVLRRIREAL